MADKPIGNLPQAPQVEDESLLAVEQRGTAMKMTGEQFRQFAEKSAKEQADAAAKSAASAAESEESAGESAEKAEVARRSIEDMTVSADTLPPGSEATVVKSPMNGSFHLRFGIPQGPQGEVGPQGAQGEVGPQGPRGINGVAVSVEGTYAFNVNENGHLICSYTGNAAPDFSIHENGHLYLNIT